LAKTRGGRAADDAIKPPFSLVQAATLDIRPWQVVESHRVAQAQDMLQDGALTRLGSCREPDVA
jgi:hypothetical protein